MSVYFIRRTSCPGVDLCMYFLSTPPVPPPHCTHACIHILTRLEQLDSLGALVRLLGVLLVDVVVDLGLRREGLEPLQDPGDELCHVGGGRGPGVGQGHVYHEDIGQDTGERERGRERGREGGGDRGGVEGKQKQKKKSKNKSS